MPLPSKTRINKDGELLRRATYEGEIFDNDVLDTAIANLNLYRKAHESPLVRVRLGAESMARTAQCGDAVVSQRLKRLPRIIKKLQRTVGSQHGRTQVARLHDIGGVRVVLATSADLQRLHERMAAQWHPNIRYERDYVNNPKDIGYRAVHIIVNRDDRPIEVQLRTRGQQAWADEAERADGRWGHRGINLKDGAGPPEMTEYFAAVSDLIYTREYGLDVSSALQQRVEAARHAVVTAGFYLH